ncbi:MAG: hypothetical protein AAF986_01435 [Pseudomonadota bacterium]
MRSLLLTAGATVFGVAPAFAHHEETIAAASSSSAAAMAVALLGTVGLAALVVARMRKANAADEKRS